MPPWSRPRSHRLGSYIHVCFSCKYKHQKTLQLSRSTKTHSPTPEFVSSCLLHTFAVTIAEHSRSNNWYRERRLQSGA
jgi:hypothetical protein